MRFATSLATVTLLLASACTTTRQAQAPQQPAPTPTSFSTLQPAVAVELLNPTLWMQTAAEYRGNALQAYRTATRNLDAALADPSWTAAPAEQSADFSSLPPAVIVDVDETVLDNSSFQSRMIAMGRGYDATEWAKWVSEAKAPAIPGAVDFAQAAAAKGVTVFFVTNRRGAEREGTFQNLQKVGFNLPADGSTLLTVADQNPTTTNDKSIRRRYIAAHYRIILLVGDALGDFIDSDSLSTQKRNELARQHDADWGLRWIILPNSMYGAWERSLTSAKDRTTEKIRLLDTAKP